MSTNQKNNANQGMNSTKNETSNKKNSGSNKAENNTQNRKNTDDCR